MSNEAFSNAVMSRLLCRIAVAIGATEAFAFGIRQEGEDDRFPTLAHIRPDNCTEPTRRAAQDSFIKLALPCIREDKDGAIELATNEDDDPQPHGGNPQYALVSLIRWGERHPSPVAMIGFIARFPDRKAAFAALKRIRMEDP